MGRLKPALNRKQVLLPSIILQGTSAEFPVMQKLGLKTESVTKIPGPCMKEEFNLTLKTEVS